MAFKDSINVLLIVLLVLGFAVHFALAQTNGFGVGYGWSVGNATPIPTPVPSPKITPLLSNSSSPQPSISNSQSFSTPQPTASAIVSPTSTPQVPEENPLLIVIILFVLGLLLTLVFKINKQKQIKLGLFTCVLFCFICCFFFVGTVSANTGNGWQIGNGWQGATTPTPTPSSPLNAATMSLPALALFALVPFISIASLVVGLIVAAKNGVQIDPKIIFGTIVLVIAINLCVILAIIIVNGISTAMPSFTFIKGNLIIQLLT